MDMSSLRTAVDALADLELKKANKLYDPFRNNHEGIAVLKEEIDEAEDERECFMTHFERAWDYVKQDDDDALLTVVKLMGDELTSQAAETIQAIAMCKKFIQLLEVNK